MIIANQKDLATGILYITIGIAVMVGASGYEIGTAGHMGPGYFPLGLGAALCLIGLIVLISSFGKGARIEIGAWPLKTILIVFFSVIAFGLALESLGLIVALPLLIGISSLAHPQFSWRIALGSIVVLLPFVWLIFIYFLGVPFQMFPAFMLQ